MKVIMAIEKISDIENPLKNPIIAIILVEFAAIFILAAIY